MSATGVLIKKIETEVDPDLELSENPMEDSGGNFDDAYEMGIRHGRAQLANELNDYLESLC